MSDLLVIEYPTEEKADEVRQKLLAMQTEYLIELGDAVVVTKCPEGHVKLNQLYSPTKAGALSGAVWGSLIGLLFLMPVAGAAIGAASGALGGRFTDVGIDDNFMKEVGETLQSGNAALFLLIRKMTTDKIAAALAGTGGKIMRSSFDETKESQLQAAFEGAQQAVAQAPAAA
nr:DUF1269 domain-containing protein [uncultured Rhodopila sp.]